MALNSPETLLNGPAKNSDSLPYLDIFDEPKLMATPAQVRLFLVFLFELLAAFFVFS